MDGGFSPREERAGCFRPSFAEDRGNAGQRWRGWATGPWHPSPLKFQAIDITAKPKSPTFPPLCLKLRLRRSTTNRAPDPQLDPSRAWDCWENLGIVFPVVPICDRGAERLRAINRFSPQNATLAAMLE